MSLPWSIDIEGIGVTGGAGGPCFLMMPHRADSQDQPLAIPGNVVETPSGARIVDKDPAIGVARHEWEFRCETRAERQFLEDWFDAREGKREPFWFPTWQWEFELRGYTWRLFDGQLWIERWATTSYADDFYPLSIAYRKILLAKGSGYKVHTVTSVTPNVATGVDLLGLNNNGTGLSVPAMGAGPNQHDDTLRPLWLRYGRFDQDVFDEEPINEDDGSCIVHLALIECPDEVPVT
jgi:hypothetical protein